MNTAQHNDNQKPRRTLTTLFHRRSIAFSFVGLFASQFPLSYAMAFAKRTRLPDMQVAVWFIVACVLTWVICISALVNLVRDVERGYSPARCGLASVILLFAFAMTGWATLGLAGMILNFR